MTAVERHLRSWAESGELEGRLTALWTPWRRLIGRDDFAQESLLRLWRWRDRLRGESEAEFAACLRIVGRSVAVDAWREVRRTRAARAGWLARRAAASPGPPPIPWEDWLSAGLSEREIDILRLRYQEELKTEVIARQLGASIAAIHQSHYRALEKLRAQAKKGTISEPGR